MGQISATYASPGLRHGLLHEDYPAHEVIYTIEVGTDIGIPEEFGGASKFVVATIEFGDGIHKPVRGWKPLPARGDADQLLVLQTKALGRALKRAGYPGDTVDLKALVAWRNRNAEIGAISAGHVTQTLSTPAAQAALGSGAVDPVAAAIDEAAASAAVRPPDGEGDEPAEGEVMPADDDVATLTDLVAGLDATDTKTFEGYLETIGAPAGALKNLASLTASQVTDCMDWLEPDHDA